MPEHFAGADLDWLNCWCHLPSPLHCLPRRQLRWMLRSRRMVSIKDAVLSQRARLSLNRILTYIRTCEAHQPYTAEVTSFVAGTIVTDIGIDMLRDDGTAVSFFYDSTTQQLKYKQGVNTAVLLNGVTAFTIKMEPMKSTANARSGGNYDLLMRATVLITLQTTDNTTGIGKYGEGNL